jgi:uncharacterized RDD family membrane protein YckC
MGVQNPSGLELLRDDKNVQSHWARRLAAIIIDGVLVTVVLSIIGLFAGLTFLLWFGIPLGSTFSAWWAGWWGFWWGGAGLFLFVYSFLAEGLYGRTLGKEIMGLRAERVDGKRLDFRDSLVRNVSKVFWALLLLDVLVGLAMNGEVSQKWSDRYIGTKVEAKTHMTIIP